MNCPKCHSANRAERNFCAMCGESLRVVTCPACGFVNRGAECFCGGCGRAINTAPSQTPAERQPFDASSSSSPGEPWNAPGALGAERRQLTALFCDLVESTALSERLDPEELRDLLHHYHEALAEIIHRFDGYIQSYSGDGLLVYFGYPRAHEDDPQRALRAGLEISAAMPALSERLRHINTRITESPLRIRIGVHTGPVVISEMTRGATRDPTAVGKTLNVAARIQALAPAGGVAISAETHNLARGYFICESLGLHQLKGISAPLEIYRVVREAAVHNRFEVQAKAGLRGIIGREAELAMLKEAWEAANQGSARILLLSGDGGIGKSRLATEFKHQVMTGKVTCIEFRCSAYHQNSPYHPVIEHLGRLMGFHNDDPVPKRFEKLVNTLRKSTLPLEEAVPLFASLLSIPDAPGYPALDLTPQRQRQRTHELLLQWFLQEAKQAPLLSIWEDLHWADPSTLELLNLVIAQAQQTRLMVIATARPEFSARWEEHPGCAHLVLDRLPHEQVKRLATQLTGGRELPDPVLEQIISKTDGVPLFVEELVRMLLESSLLRESGDSYVLAGPLPPLAIPSTLQDSLMARLDRLSAEKEVVRLGAVLGREFSYELIRAVWPLDTEGLARGLNAVVGAGLLRQTGTFPDVRYTFGHALIQDAAYESLLKSRRQQLHQQVAEVMERNFATIAEGQPELLAHHYAAAGKPTKSIGYWLRAAEKSARRSANKEAVSQIARGLELLPLLPDDAERARLELRLQLTLGAPMVATKGYSAPEVKQTFMRAHELCGQLGNTGELFPVLFRLRSFYLVHGELEVAREIGEQLLRLGRRAEDPSLMLEAHYALGAAMFYLGEFVPAQSQFESMRAIYDRERHSSHAFIYGQDPGVAALSYEAWTLGYLGYPDRAVERVKQALMLSASVAHTFSQAFAWTFAAMFYQQRNDPDAVLTHSEKGIMISREHGFPLWLSMATMLRGWALSTRGRYDEAIAEIEKGLAGYREIGAGIAQAHFTAVLAQACSAAGRHKRALTLITNAVKEVESSGERSFAAAEIHRLRGELLLAQSADQTEIAREEFQRALAIAEHQQAKTPQLRATVSLCQLMAKRGDFQGARALLAPIHDWFVEGFDSPDYKNAASVRNALN
jgi:class 3 adenylate cyclase/predicted ATPase